MESDEGEQISEQLDESFVSTRAPISIVLMAPSLLAVM